MTDLDLLLQYVREGSEDAFRDLVQRRIGLVYGAALRQLGGDEHRAKDVTQEVFARLARKASSLTKHPSLLGWLYATTRYLCVDVVRSESSRKRREEEAHAMHDSTPENQIGWDTVRPVLDEALCELSESHRQTVLARFFAHQSFAEIGEQFGVSENAAQKSVHRALDQLRAALSRRGITSTAAGLGFLLANQPAVALPAGLMTAASGTALAGAGGGMVLFMGINKIALGITGALAIAGAAGFGWQTRSNLRLQHERETLQQQIQAGSQTQADNERAMVALRAQVAATGNPPRKEGATSLRSDSDPAAIAEMMKRAGISDLVIYRAVRTAVTVSHQEERLKIVGLGKEGMSRHQPSLTLTREQTEQLQELEAREIAEARALVGPVKEVDQMVAGSLKKKYGDLSPGKLAAVQAIENDYEEIAKNVGAPGPGGMAGLSPEGRAKIAMEMETDLRNVLTPAEATDYLRFNSKVAQELQRQLSKFVTDEETYVKLADVALASEASTRSRIVDSNGQFELKTELYGKYRSILGERDFLLMTRSLDGVASSTVPVYQAARLSPERQGDLFFTARQAYFALGAAAAADRPSIAAQAYQALTTGAGLSPEQTSSFDKTRLGSLLKQAAGEQRQ